MLDPDALNVWFEHRLVGYLWQNRIGYIGFRYESDWLSTGGFAISQTLPLRSEEFPAEDGIAHRFFANLLPEGGARDHIVRDLKITNSDFSLLRAIGGECAGALSILEVEQEPKSEQHYRPLSTEELATLVSKRGQIYANWPANKRPRLSLAGAQNKCPVLIRDGNYFLPQDESPSSHILKFEITDYRHLPAYETFTTLLAHQIGLPVVNISLQHVEKQRYAQIERYDRVIWGNDLNVSYNNSNNNSNNKGKIKRLHQEDFCQALGYGHEKKYQDAGGPRFADCLQLLQNVSTDPAIDIQHLLTWQVFNVLAGNSDGHAKNLSLLYLSNGEIRLAPFYDLICTRAIERIDYHLAFDVGGQRDPGQLSKKHWDKFAEQCDVGSRYVAQLLQNTSSSLLQHISQTKTLFEENYGDYPSLQRIEHVVKQQCNKAQRQ